MTEFVFEKRGAKDEILWFIRRPILRFLRKFGGFGGAYDLIEEIITDLHYLGPKAIKLKDKRSGKPLSLYQYHVRLAFEILVDEYGRLDEHFLIDDSTDEPIKSVKQLIRIASNLQNPKPVRLSMAGEELFEIFSAAKGGKDKRCWELLNHWVVKELVCYEKRREN